VESVRPDGSAELSNTRSIRPHGLTALKWGLGKMTVLEVRFAE
jgi:hypothetical protein